MATTIILGYWDIRGVSNDCIYEYLLKIGKKELHHRARISCHYQNFRHNFMFLKVKIFNLRIQYTGGNYEQTLK